MARRKKFYCDKCEAGPYKTKQGLSSHERSVHPKRGRPKKKRGRPRKKKTEKTGDGLGIVIEKINDDGIVIPVRIKLIIEVTQE